MDNAATLKTSNVVVAGNGNNNHGFGARLGQMPAKSKLTLGIGVAALVGVVLAMTMWSSQGDYKVLYANLVRQGRRRDHRPAVADERALQTRRRRCRDPGAGPRRYTTCA